MTTQPVDHVSSIDWIEKAQQIALPEGIFIDGGFRLCAETREIITPRDGSVLGTLAWAGVDDTDRAVAAARRAFDDGPWPTMAGSERGLVLNRWADLIDEHRDEIALLVSLEMGKPIRHAWEIELRALINGLRFYAGLADKAMGEIPRTPPGDLAIVTREPSGVVAAVVPWNFPLTIGGWKVGPALAAGCTMVLKTAEQSPLSMQRVAALGAEAGMPEGVFNVLSGDGTVVGRRLGEHPDVNVLTFTGSTEVGRHFMRYAADSNLKKVHLELGGKSPHIIFPEATDLQAAADSAAWAIFFNAGEMCTAGSRLVVHEDIAEEVIARVIETSAAWQPADPLLPDTLMGPLVDKTSLTRIQKQLAQGLEQGATVRSGGSAVHTDSGGPYLAPTVITDAARDNLLVQEELFGPVLAVQTFSTEAEAIEIARDTPYGLAAGLWTSDLGRAHRVSNAMHAGIVWVNCYEEGDMSVPFGGVKLTGGGRDKSHHAMDEYTDLKTTWVKYG
ncbi:aldehyde dehydrogenase family protein [Ornithinimicrobium sp. Arc0846-15]|nr:aldehyde dehydrogenase family protein [Ornithinimicrobium laminariae]